MINRALNDGFNKAQLGSVTVWYNPEPGFVDNINSYAGHSNLVVVVDNSDSGNEGLFNKIANVNKKYIGNKQNLGIAKALNQGINVLMANGFKFALTLDQDSFFETGEIGKLLTAAEDLDWNDVGVLSPIHVQQKNIPVYNLTAYTPATCVMTSGNILNLAAAEKVNFFKEDLFIDHVDNEFCLRLHLNGYKVLIANAFLTHELGRYKEARFLGLSVGGFISHPPQRLYYFVRNAIYIIRTYTFIDFKYTMSEVTALIKRFFKIFFEDDKAKRFRAYFKGIYDYSKLKN
jgi:rhamnosyltransferase